MKSTAARLLGDGAVVSKATVGTSLLIHPSFACQTNRLRSALEAL